MKKKLGLLILFVAFLFLPQTFYAQTNLLTNGSFETGDFTGWTSTSTQTQHYCTAWSVRNTFTCNGTAAPAQDGSFLAGNGFDGRGGVMRIYQDVTLPSLLSIPLTFTYRINWNIPSASNQARVFQVNIHDTTDNLLQTLYTFTANSGTPNQTTGWVTETVYLNQFYGQTVRISFTNIIPQSFTGPGQFAIDDITLQAFGPTSANVEIGGQVTNAKGYGIGNALITFTDSNGETRIARTNPFGFYKFKNVEVGNTYLFEVSHRRYEFSDNVQIVNLDNARSDINFISDGFRVRGNRIPKIE